MNPTEKPTFQDNSEMSLYNNYSHLLYSPATTSPSDNFYFYTVPMTYSNQLTEPQYFTMAPEPVDKEVSIPSPTLAYNNSATMSPTALSSPQSLTSSFNFQNINSLVYSQQQSTPQPAEVAAKKYDYSYPTPTESNTSSCSSETTQGKLQVTTT